MPPLHSLKRASHLSVIFANNTETEISHEETLDRPTHESVSLWNNWPLLFKGVKIIKDKERLRNCQRREEAKETWQLNAM